MIPWERTHKFDAACARLADGHYSRRTPGSPQFMPPGETIVLATRARDAVFGWWRPHPKSGIKAMNGLDGWTCSIFRNTSAFRSSALIVAAERALVIAGVGCGPSGLITYVWCKKVRSPNPGFCFQKAGWRKTGWSADKRKRLLMKPFEQAGRWPEGTMNETSELCDGKGWLPSPESNGHGFFQCEGCPACAPPKRRPLAPLKRRQVVGAQLDVGRIVDDVLSTTAQMTAVIDPGASKPRRKTLKIRVEGDDGVMRDAEIPAPEEMVPAPRPTHRRTDAPTPADRNRTAKSGGRSKGNDFYLTPADFLEAVRKVGRIELDPCGSAAGSLVQADREYLIERGEDGLALSWKIRLGALWFCNPPYSKTRQWIEKADAEFKRLTSGLLLVASRTGAIAFQGARAPFICFIGKRLMFLDPKTHKPPVDADGKPTGAMFDSAVLAYIHPHQEGKFRDAFSSLGKIVRWNP